MKLCDVKVGDTFYLVKRVPIQAKKITREIDGQVWYRYDNIKDIHKVEKYKLVGKVTPIIEGDIGDANVYVEYYCIDYSVNANVVDNFFFDDDTIVYADKNVAEAALQQLSDDTEKKWNGVV